MGCIVVRWEDAQQQITAVFRVRGGWAPAMERVVYSSDGEDWVSGGFVSTNNAFYLAHVDFRVT